MSNLRSGVSRAVALAGALLLAADASAQGLFDLFGPDRPAAPRATREAPRAARKPRAESRSSAQDRPGAESRGKKKREGAKADKKTDKKDAAKPEGKAVEAPPPPYEGQMLRLAEVLGALSFLRDLCGSKDGEDWRGKMSALLDAEAPEGSRREALVAAFNRGFRGFELTYRVCTPNAGVVTARYLEEAGRISRDITYRYGAP
jgi:uncharacterized protein (TIGR02301 family)